MAEIVAVHGILNEFAGPETLKREWEPAILDGLHLAGCTVVPTVGCAFYGDLFRPLGKKASGPPLLGPEDVDGDLELGLMLAWWSAAAEAEPNRVVSPAAKTKVSVPESAQRALRALMNSRFFGALAGRYGERALVFALRQVRLYLEDEAVRERAQMRVRECLEADTKVVVAHSLGSVVAYEALCSWEKGEIPVLVTLGSPLGMSPIIFKRLRPAPRDGRGAWPAVGAWWNVADKGDLVALQKDLHPFFGSGSDIRDVRVGNGWESHDVLRYLTARETGEAIASGL